MDIKSSREGDRLSVWLSGDFCAECVPATEVFFNGNLAGVKNLKVDFGGVSRLTKEGLMLLLSVRKKLAGAAMSLVNVGAELYERLEEQGIATLMDVRRRAE